MDVTLGLYIYELFIVILLLHTFLKCHISTTSPFITIKRKKKKDLKMYIMLYFIIIKIIVIINKYKLIKKNERSVPSNYDIGYCF